MEINIKECYDRITKIIERLAKIEQWTRDHKKVHVLEERAITVAKESTDRRLDEMNQLRKQIESERGLYVLREYYDREHKNLKDDIIILRESRSEISGEHGMIEKFWEKIWMLALALIMFVIGHLVWK